MIQVRDWKPGWWLWLFAVGLWLIVGGQLAWSQSALIPNGQQTFFGQGGAPLGLGFVYMYVPGTTTSKLTWQDPKLMTPNTNPIQLDSNGQARIWGQGQYRQIVQDSLGNTIYDQLTSADGEAGSGAWVANNAGLKALLPGAFTYANRAGFLAAGDGGALTYYWQSGPCSIGSGNGDNGAQVKPNTGTGCWVGDFSGVTASPLIWGCKGDGATNDSTCFQNAVSFLSGNLERPLWLGPHLYCLNGIVTFQPINIQGTGPGGSIPGQSGLVACSGNGVMISLGNDGMGNSADGTILENFYINALYLGSDTNTAISQQLVNNVVERHLVISEPCIGIEEAGVGNTVDDVHIIGSVGTHNCGAIRVGKVTSGGATDNFKVINSYIHTNTDWGIFVLDASHMFMNNDQIQLSGNGLLIIPGTNQYVLSLMVSNSVFDSAGGAGIRLDSLSATARFRELNFVNTQTSFINNDNGVDIANNFAADMSGIHFLGHRSFGNLLDGINVATTNITNLTIDNGTFCGNGRSGIGLTPNLANFAIRGNLSGRSPICTSGAGNQVSGINLGTGTSQAIITENDLRFNTGWPPGGTLVGQAPGGDSVIANNQGVDTQSITIASTSVMALPINPVAAVTGSTPVTNMTGGWFERVLQLVTIDGPVAFQTGGAGATKICNGLTSVQNVPVIATYMTGLSCWAVK